MQRQNFENGMSGLRGSEECQQEQEEHRREREAFQHQVCDLFIFDGTYMLMIHVDCMTFEGHGDEVVGWWGG
jgi:hypothetical protein